MNQSSWTKESISKALSALEDLLADTTSAENRALGWLLDANQPCHPSALKLYQLLELIHKAQHNVLIDRRDNANAHHHMHQS